MMIKKTFHILKQMRVCNYKFCSSNSNKEYLTGLVEYAMNINELKKPVDHLKFLREDNAHNSAAIDLQKKFKTNDSSNITERNDEMLYSNDINNIEFDQKLVLSNDVQVTHDANNEDNQHNNDVTIEVLHRDIEEIKLDDLNKVEDDSAPDVIINRSTSTLENLLKFGVDLNEVERRGGSTVLLSLDWETDVLPVISFLKNQCPFADRDIAHILSHYPKIVERPLHELKRIFHYFNCRRINSDSLASMLAKRPHICSFSSDHIGKRLADIETKAKLTMDEMNAIVVTQPDVLTGNLVNLKSCLAYLSNGAGFTDPELRAIVIGAPQVLITKQADLSKNFIFLHRALKLCHEEIAERCGAALAASPSTLVNRVNYLKFLKSYQPDPVKDHYISISDIAGGTEKEFCEHLANSSVTKFRKYLRSI